VVGDQDEIKNDQLYDVFGKNKDEWYQENIKTKYQRVLRRRLIEVPDEYEGSGEGLRADQFGGNFGGSMNFY
jgi:hypothetical protein